MNLYSSFSYSTKYYINSWLYLGAYIFYDWLYLRVCSRPTLVCSLMNKIFL